MIQDKPTLLPQTDTCFMMTNSDLPTQDTEDTWYSSTFQLNQSLQSLMDYPSYVQELIGKEMYGFARELSYSYAIPESQAKGEEASLEGLKRLRYFMQNKQHHIQVGRALNEIMMLNEAGRTLMGRHLSLCVQGLDVLKQRLEDDELSLSPQNRVVVFCLVQAVFGTDIESIETRARERAAREAAEQLANEEAKMAELALLEAAALLESLNSTANETHELERKLEFLQKDIPQTFEPVVKRLGRMLTLTLSTPPLHEDSDTEQPANSHQEMEIDPAAQHLEPQHHSVTDDEEGELVEKVATITMPPARKPALNLEDALAQFNAMEATTETDDALEDSALEANSIAEEFNGEEAVKLAETTALEDIHHTALDETALPKEVAPPNEEAEVTATLDEPQPEEPIASFLDEPEQETPPERSDEERSLVEESVIEATTEPGVLLQIAPDQTPTKPKAATRTATKKAPKATETISAKKGQGGASSKPKKGCTPETSPVLEEKPTRKRATPKRTSNEAEGLKAVAKTVKPKSVPKTVTKPTKKTSTPPTP
jgi:hypothetical protein